MCVAALESPYALDKTFEVSLSLYSILILHDVFSIFMFYRCNVNFLNPEPPLKRGGACTTRLYAEWYY